MPNAGLAAAGVIGGVLALGYLIWQLVMENPRRREIPHGESSFRPEPGYDRPRDSWTDEINDHSQRRQRRGRAECAICTESLAGKDIRHLPCTHIFHDDCITKWFRESRTCPTCRQPA